MKYHPDKTQGDKEKEEIFQEITKAYNMLKDKDMRRLYDLTVMTKPRPPCKCWMYGDGNHGYARVAGKG